MDFREKHKSFKKRFGIVDQQLDPAKEFQIFKQRILNIFIDIDINTKEEGIAQFCTRLGKRIIIKNFMPALKYNYNIINILEEETDEAPFYFLIEMLFTLPIEIRKGGNGISYSKGILYENTAEAFSISNINASICKVGDEVLVFPRGEEILDKELVEEVFIFLNENSKSHFLSAVKSYREGTSISYVKSAESIRRCIEEFLRYKMNNIKGLDNNLKQLGAHLKEKHISSEIKTLIHQFFTYLDKYFNENSKHNDGQIGEAENEFLLYQSGLLLRYINKVI